MWNPSDLPGSLGAATQRTLRVGLAIFLYQIAALALSVPVLAQPAPPAASAASAESRQSLRQLLERSYEVLPLHNGVVLRPRKERLGVRTIEVSGDTIAVNGERVTDGVLRAWLAEDADPILRLHRLPARERQALFGMPSGSASSAAEAVTDETEIPAEEDLPAEGQLPAETADAPETEIPEVPEPPEPPAAEEPDYPSSTTGSKVNLFGDITVDKDELAEEAVAILGTVRVEGEVSRDVTAVGGSVVINGRVGGGVTAVGGGVRLGPEAVVDGDVTSVGGSVVRAEGSQVHGQTSEVAMVPPHRGDDWEDVDISFRPWSPFFSGMDLFWRLAGVGILALLVCLVLLVARGTIDKVEVRVAREPWLAGGVGLLTIVLLALALVPVTILLIITIVGCALIALYPFLIIALWLAAFVGYSAVALRIGRFLEARFGRSFGSPYSTAMVGVIAIEALSILGAVISLGGGFLDFIAFAVLTVGFLVQFVAWIVGFGAVLLARFGGPPAGLVPVMAPPPPPPPAPVPYDPVLAPELAPAPDNPGPDRP